MEFCKSSHIGSNPILASNTRMVELVDTAVLEAVAERLESSSLSLGTLKINGV